YRIVQRNAMDTWDGKGHLKDLLAADPEVVLSNDDLEECFSLDRVAQTSSVVFDRLEG
ncbi:MAG: adenylosuccinate lyase, partial [Akkermansiaceae bacterium]|nr:adenylosuccinate lyase [Akkermansiaceae bacterium]